MNLRSAYRQAETAPRQPITRQEGRSLPSSTRSRYQDAVRSSHVSDAGVFAEFERSIIVERVNAGLARAEAKASGLDGQRSRQHTTTPIP